MKEIADEEVKKTVTTYLKEQSLGVIATINPDNTPEAATVNYLYQDLRNIYVLSHTHSRKVQNIKNNQSIAFVIGTTLDLHTVQIQGKATIIAQNETPFQELLMQFLQIRSLYYAPLLKIPDANYVIIHISITWLRWLEYNEYSKNVFYTTVLEP